MHAYIHTTYITFTFTFMSKFTFTFTFTFTLHYITLHYITLHTSIHTSYASNFPLFCHDSTARRWQVYHCQGLFKTAAVLAHDGQDLMPKLGFCSPEKLGKKNAKKSPNNKGNKRSRVTHSYPHILRIFCSG